MEILSEKLSPTTMKLWAVSQGTPITRAEFLAALEDAPEFRLAFNAALAAQEFGSFFWETPLLGAENLSEPFECVLVQSDGLAERQADEHSFARYFEGGARDVVVIDNLGGDARLVVPGKLAAAEIYTDIASFTRHAPEAQRDALWQVTARATKERLKERKVWLSTSGWGVAWLHIRLDDRPKYYTHQAYKDAI